MRKLILAASFVACIMFFAIACSSYGEKVNVNDKSEVYYKEGSTKEEASKVGEFLLRNSYFDSTSEKSIQITKNKDTNVVRFVVDEAKLKSTANAETLFSIMQMLLKDSVFNGKPTKVILADEKFKDLKEIKEFKAEAESTGNVADSTQK